MLMICSALADLVCFILSLQLLLTSRLCLYVLASQAHRDCQRNSNKIQLLSFSNGVSFKQFSVNPAAFHLLQPRTCLSTWNDSQLSAR